MNSDFVIQIEKLNDEHRALSVNLKVSATKLIAQAEKKCKEIMNEMEIHHKSVMENLKNRHKVEMKFTRSVIYIHLVKYLEP
jgi:hypothetical protein